MRLFGKCVFHLVLYAAVCLLLTQPDTFSGDQHLWPDWYTLVTRNQQELSGYLDDRIAYISPGTLNVTVNDFSGEREVPLAEIPERFSPLDPRIDPFIRLLPELFRARWNGEEAQILYLERSLSLRELDSLLVSGGFDDGDYLLADQDRSSSKPALLLFSIAALIIVLLLPKYRLLSALIILPWGLGIMVAGNQAILLSLLALFALPRLIELVLPVLIRRCHDRTTGFSTAAQVEAGFIGLGLIIGMAIYGGFASFVDFLKFPFSAALAGFSILRFRILIEERKQLRMLHPLFIPVSLIRERSGHGRTMLQAMLAAAAMTIAVLLPPGAMPDRLEIPRPVAAGIDAENPEETLTSLRLIQDDDLPGLSLYLTHRYFQENYLYAPDFVLPAYGDELTINSYNRRDGHIEAEVTSVWRFTYGWYAAIIESDTDRINQFFIHNGVPRGIQRTEVTAAAAPLNGLFPGLALLLSLLAGTLFRIFRQSTLHGANRRFDSRRMGETA